MRNQNEKVITYAEVDDNKNKDCSKAHVLTNLVPLVFKEDILIFNLCFQVERKFRQAERM
jgi:hypothetical protein